ncbi:hypothetical protein LGM39_36810 [Burkholderia cepacia]|nr:hypothetical protein [Burkholderia cepacia]
MPIYPLRYGIADRVLEKKVFPTLSTDGYPALTGGKAYGLRVLRPGTYVYLCYFENGRMWTQHYQVTDDMRFARIWWTRADDNDATPGRLARPDMAGAKPFLLAPESKTAEIVYLMVSETMLTHARLWNIEIDKGGIRTKLATKVKPSGGIEQTHAFNIALVASAAPELVRPTLNGKSGYYKWSEIAEPEKFTTHDAVITGAHIALAPTKGIVPLAVVLHDPIGITSELAHLAAVAAAERQVYEADNNHAYTSATMIKQYLQSLQKHAGVEAYAKRQKLVRYYANDNADRAHGNAIPFMLSYERDIKAKQSEIETQVNDLEGWIRTAGSAMGEEWREGWFSKALSCFDLGAKENAQGYEHVIARCVGSLTLSQRGRSAYRDLLLAAPGKSPVWLALAHGIPELHNHFDNPPVLKSVLDIGVSAFAPIFQLNLSYPATQHSDLLASQMLSQLADMNLPDTTASGVVRRLRLYAEVRVGSTIVTYRVTSTEANFQYAQFRGERSMNTEQLRKWGITVVRPLRNQPANVLLFEEVRIGDKANRISPVQPTASNTQKFKLEGNVFKRMMERMRQGRAYSGAQTGVVRGEYAFTGLAAVSALMALRSSIKDITNNKVDRSVSGLANGVNAFAAAAAVIGAGMFVQGDLIQLRALARGESLATARRAALSARTLATRVGAITAALGAISDGIRASNAFNVQQNSEAGRMYLASAGSGMLAAAGLLLNAASVTLGFMGPVGWLVLALVATVGVAYFSYQAALAKFQPDEVWLAHSYWSLGESKYRYKSLEQELVAFHGAVYGVRAVANWETPSTLIRDVVVRSIFPIYGIWQDGMDLKRTITKDGVGTLSISLVLPNYPTLEPDATDLERAGVFQYTLTVRRNGSALKMVQGPIAVAPGYRFPYDTECMVVSEDIIREGTRQLSWRITMRADTEVMLDYCYRPDVMNQPSLVLLPQREPLVFTRGTWFTDPIDDELIAPVKDPE